VSSHHSNDIRPPGKASTWHGIKYTQTQYNIYSSTNVCFNHELDRTKRLHPLLGCLLCKRSGSCRSVVSEYSPNMWYRSAPRKLLNSHARVGSISPFLPTQCVPIARSQRRPSNTTAPLRLAPLLVSRYPPPQVPPPSFVLLAMRGT
jgi:hypothetical protein